MLGADEATVAVGVAVAGGAIADAVADAVAVAVAGKEPEVDAVAEAVGVVAVRLVAAPGCV